MPMTVVQVDTMKNMHDNLRATLGREDVPEYAYKERRAGFEICHADRREGETSIIWHTFTEGDGQTEMRTGLERCADVLQEHYWIKLDVATGQYGSARRTTLRVILRLNWLA